MLSAISLKAKLLAAFLVIASLIGLTSFLGVTALNRIHAEYDRIIGSDVTEVFALEDIRFWTTKVQADRLLYARGFDEVLTPEERLERRVNAQDSVQRLEKSGKTYETDILSAAGSNQSVSATIVVDVKNIADGVTELIALQEQRASKATIATKEAIVRANERNLIASLDVVRAQQLVEIESGDAVADTQTQQLVNTSIAVAVVGVLAAVLLGLGLALSIAQRVRRLADGTMHIASGDFTHKIIMRSKDELGRLAEAFNQMGGRLQESYRRIAYEKERDEALLESLGEGLVAIDQEGHITLVNTLATTLLELPARVAITGKSIFDVYTLYGADDKPLAKDKRPAFITLQTGLPTSDVYGFHRQSGSKIMLSVGVYPIIIEGKTSGAIVVLRDVTKEKEVDRMKTEFISLASHQLRTPLSAIKWFTEMLIEGDGGKLNDEQMEFAQNVSDSTQRMIELVNSLLNISRIESGRIIIDPKPTDLRKLVGGIVNDLKAKTEQKKQTLIVSVHKDLAEINIDPRLIGQVYLNFLTNAIKYTPKGGEISVMISRKDEQIISQITDNGYGIPVDEQKRVFQKFFRADNVAKFETDGTGLGLYLVKAIIESSGGKVWFESTEGKGTTFWFSLPASGMKAKEGEVTLDI